MKYNFAVFAVVISALLALTACSHKDYEFAGIANKTYRAVDGITDQAEGRAGMNTPIVVSTLANIDTMEQTGSLGRIIGEMASSRLVQQGFVVPEIKLRTSMNVKRGFDNPSEAGEFILTRDVESLRQDYKVGQVLTGTYGIAGQEILVNMKLIDIASGRILGAEDFSLPLNGNTLALTREGASFSFYGQSMAY